MAILTLFKTPKRKTSRRSYLIKALDDLMSLKVRERDHHACRKCGVKKQGGRVYHHHLMTKTRLTTRWIMENGVTLCFWDHRWAHSAPEEFRAWVLSWMPEKQYNELYLRSQMRGGYKEIDLEWLIRDLKKAAKCHADAKQAEEFDMIVRETGI